VSERPLLTSTRIPRRAALAASSSAPRPRPRPCVPRGLRARPGRADVPAEAARGSAAARRPPIRAERALPTQGDRLVSERLLLQVATGAASERLYVSYPRIELTESRARVPSFYALDMMRAVTVRSRS
jgi:hypothetical protein